MAIQPASTTSLTLTQQAITLLPTDEQRAVILFLGSIPKTSTRDAYGRDIATYIQWLNHTAAGRHWSLLDANSIAAAHWTRHLLEVERLATATVKRRQAALSKFYRWSSRPGRFNEGRMNPFDAQMLDRVKASSNPTDALSAQQVAALLTAAAGGPHPDRDWVIIAVLATTGIRVSELCGADRDHLAVTPAGAELVVHGKGDKIRRAPLINELANRIPTSPPGAPIITANDGGRLNRHQVERILRRLGRQVGIRRLTPHMLRATQITEALGRGEPLWAVQDNAGHADPRTTRAYQRRAQSAAARQAMAAGLWAAYQDA